MNDTELIRIWAETVNGLEDNWEPHSDQRKVIDSIFFDEVLSIFIRCGRKWGKTEIALYLLWRIARQFPDSPCYYFAAQQNQARSILWEDPRIKHFGPRDWLLPGNRGIAEGDMVLRFTNGSFIKIDGTDNYNKYRGVRYKISVYDEYKDADPRMRKAMRPNAAVLRGIDVFMGSPPDTTGSDYELLDIEHQTNPEKRAFHAPTWANPHISKDWLRDEKTGLYRRNEGDEWEREYAAKYVRGGASLIFPMLSKKMVRPHEQLVAEIKRDRKKLQWFWWADPAGATCFAVLFLAINPFSKKIYVLDEIYEKRQSEMTVKKLGARILDIRADLYDEPRAWREGYDEAATWFLNEWIAEFPKESGLEPSQKSKNDKTDGLSLIKDIMLYNLVTFSDRCVNLFKELNEYQKDKNGKIPKVNDHLIDDFRYILGASYYNLKGYRRPISDAERDRRGTSLKSDLDQHFGDGYDLE